MTTRRQFLRLAGPAFAMPALPGRAWAQSWPAKPIRAMIPFSAGSSLDIVGRIVLDPLSSQLGQPIVVENRGGAGGTIGSAMVAKADPDGYTILINASAHSAAPAAYPNVTYDPARDFSAVIPFGTIPNVTVISPAKGIKTIGELVAAAKSRSLTYASAGVGSATHWAAERLRVSAGFQAIHVPFRGGPEALTEVTTGRVDFSCMGMSAALGIHPRRPAHSARRELSQAFVGAAGRPDDAGVRPRRFRLQLLDGTVRPRQHPARHCRSVVP